MRGILRRQRTNLDAGQRLTLLAAGFVGAALALVLSLCYEDSDETLHCLRDRDCSSGEICIAGECVPRKVRR